jgi:hypothetical protein
MTWNPQPVPKQEYNYEVEVLVAEYKRAAERIRDLLLRAPLDMKSVERQRLLREITEILRELDASAEAWIEKNIPKAYQEGAAGTIITLGEAPTLKKAMELVSTNRLNRQFIEAMVADTMEDLLQMTHNTELQVKKFIRQIVGEQLRK